MKRGGKDAAIDTAFAADLHLDLYDYRMPVEPRSSQRRRRKWNPTIIDDWPEEIPISKWELDFFEVLLGDELDRILGILK